MNISRPGQHGGHHKGVVIVSGTLLQKSYQTLLDLLWPAHCVHCKSVNGWLCQNCLGQIPLITTCICQRCGRPVTGPVDPLCRQCESESLNSIDGIRGAAYYLKDNPIRSAIHFLKYYNHRAVVSILGKILVDTYWQYHLETEVIIPVPLHPARLQERGYNQSELLAREVGKFLQLQLNTKALRRIRKTESQTQLTAEGRRQNVADAFSCCTGELAGRTVLLIDDVCTTGATLDACAYALKKEGGVASVWGLTLARAC